MATDYFSNLLEEIGMLLKVELKPDSNNSCIISFPTGVKVQLEIDTSGEKLLIASLIGSPPAGKYREELFKIALISNTLPRPMYGTFAFSRKVNTLILFHMMPIENLNAEDVIEFITPFTAKAEKWKNAVDQGDIPDISLVEGPSSGGHGLFGLTP